MHLLCSNVGSLGAVLGAYTSASTSPCTCRVGALVPCLEYTDSMCTACVSLVGCTPNKQLHTHTEAKKCYLGLVHDSPECMWVHHTSQHQLWPALCCLSSRLHRNGANAQRSLQAALSKREVLDLV